MNYLKLAAIAALAICFSANLFAQEISEYKRYPYKSGIVEYEITGNTYKGTATLYWDNYGMKEALFTDKVWKKGFIKLHSVISVEIIDGDYSYDIDLDDEEGTKTKNNYAEKYGNLETADEIYKQTLEMMKELGFDNGGGKSNDPVEYGGVELPSGVPGVTSSNSSSSKKNVKRICGKDCEVFKLKKGETSLTYYMWQGITLASDEILPKIPMVGQPQFTKKCTSVKVDIAVPQDKFSIPKKVKIEDKE